MKYICPPFFGSQSVSDGLYVADFAYVTLVSGDTVTDDPEDPHDLDVPGDPDHHDVPDDPDEPSDPGDPDVPDDPDDPDEPSPC